MRSEGVRQKTMRNKKTNRKNFLRILCSFLIVIAISGCSVIYSAVVCGVFSPSDILISPDKLPVAIVNQPYQVAFSTAQNQTLIGDFYISSGKLPTGIEFVSVEELSGEYRATLEGIPSEIGDFPITMTAWSYGTQCPGQIGSQTYIITVK